VQNGESVYEGNQYDERARKAVSLRLFDLFFEVEHLYDLRTQ
jgi:hypothetical protein